MVEALLQEDPTPETLLLLTAGEVFLFNILRTDPGIIEEQMKKLKDSGLYEDIKIVETTYHPDGTSALNYVALVASLRKPNDAV